MARWTAEWKELSFEKKLALVGAPLLVAVVVGLVISPLSTLLADRTTTRLEVVDLAVLDSPAGGEDRQYVPPQVEVLVRNTGDLVSVVSRATFEVMDYGILEICQAGGVLDLSAAYAVVLPTGDEAVGERVPVDVRQEIRVGEADRFGFELTVPEERINDYAVHLYRLGVRLERDGGRGLEAGMAVVSVPRAVDRWYFDEDAAAYGEDVAACYARNAATYERFARLDGTRSASMTHPR